MANINPLLPLIQAGMQGVEIGVGQAFSSVEMLRRGVTLLCVDPWEPTPDWQPNSGNALKWRTRAMENLAPWLGEDLGPGGGLAVLFVGTSEAAARLKAEPDFVFVDGDKRYEGVSQDIRLWWAKLKSGGWIGGPGYFDSTNPSHQVRRAVDDWAQETANKIEVFSGCWVARK